jgi:catechol 2,3-dioxygenase-like lactoylglutathione lyase family enzyme
MLRGDQQLARACRALLETVRLERLWTEEGPTPEAAELLQMAGRQLSQDERNVLLVAWTFWNGSGRLRLAELLEHVDADPMAALCTFVTARRGAQFHEAAVSVCETDESNQLLPWRNKMLLKPAKDSVDLCVVVRDIGRSLDFYQTTLGLEKTQEVATPYGNVHRLRFGTSLVKLMDPKQVPPAGPIGLEKQLGIRFMSFAIRNLSEVCTALEEKGVEFTIAETEVLPGLRVAMVKDPDGNIIELVEQGQGERR